MDGKKPADLNRGTSGGRKKPDWEAIERDYRTGRFSDQELADKHGNIISRQAINKRAKVRGWQKDLTDAIRKATNASLVAEAAAKKVAEQVAKGSSATVDSVVVAAEINTQVILKHRAGLQRITRIKETMLDQIEQAAMQMPDLAEVIEMVRNPDENGMDKANDALRKAMSRTSLVDDLKKLAEVDEKVRKGEREAFNITGGEEGGTAADAMARFMAELSARGSRLPVKKSEQ